MLSLIPSPPWFLTVPLGFLLSDCLSFSMPFFMSLYLSSRLGSFKGHSGTQKTVALPVPVVKGGDSGGDKSVGEDHSDSWKRDLHPGPSSDSLSATPLSTRHKESV